MSLISLFDLVNFTENEKKTIETAEHSSIDFSSVWERILLTIKELQTSESDSTHRISTVVEELESIQEERDALSLKYELCMKQKEEIETDLENEKLNCVRAREKNQRIMTEFDLKSEELVTAVSERNELAQEIDKFTSQISLLKESKIRSEEKVESLKKVLEEKEDAIVELKVSLDKFSMKYSSMADEKSSMEAENKKLDDALIAMSSEFSSFRKEKLALIAELRVQVRQNSDNFEKAAEMEKNAKDKVSELSALYKDLSEKHRDIKNEFTEEREQFLGEMSEKERLCELYKITIEELNGRITHLESLCADSESKWTQIKLDYESRIQALEEENSELSTSLENLKSTSDTRRASPRKKSQSEVDFYAKYASSQSELISLKREYRKIQEQFTELMQDYENKTAIKSDLVEQVNALKTSIIEASKCEEIQTKKIDDLNRKISVFEKDNSLLNENLIRAELHAKDLGKQIQFLLKEVEDLDSTGMEEDGIPNSLLSFRNIEELQKRNEELMLTIRAMSKKIEEYDESQRDQVESKLLLARLSSEIQELKDSREKQTSMYNFVNFRVDSLVKQRDMLKAALETNSVMPGKPHVDDNYREMYEHLRTEMDTLISDHQAYDKALQEENHKLTKELSSIRFELSKNESQMEFIQSRFDMLNVNYSGALTENDQLSQKNDALQTELLSQQQRIQTLLNDILSLKDSESIQHKKLADLNAQVSVLQKNLDLERDDKYRLQSEKEKLFTSLKNIENLRNQLSQDGEESRAKLETQNEFLNRELSALKSNFGNEKNELLRKISLVENENQSLKVSYESASSAINDYKEELVKAKCRTEEFQRRCSSLESSLISAETRVNLLITQASKGNDVAILGKELSSLKAENASLLSEIELAKKNSQHYKTLASENTIRLKELEEAYDLYKKKVQQASEVEFAEKSKIEDQVKDLTAKNHDLSNSFTLAISEKENILSLNQKLKTRVEQLEVIEQQFLNNESGVKADLAALQKQYSQLKQQSEKEIISHAEDINELKKLRNENQEMHSRLIALQKTVEESQRMLDSVKISSNQAKEVYDKQLESNQSRIKELAEQNDVLLNQIESLASHARSSVKSIDVSVSEESDAANEGEQTQLKEVIRYLRREKEILQCEHDILRKDSEKLTSKLRQSELLLAESRSRLSDLQSSDERYSKLEREHELLLDRISSMNNLQEMNVSLVSENKKLTSQLLQLQSATKSSEESLASLKNKIAELEKLLETSATEKNQLLADIQKWKSKTSDVLNKYKQTDPEEIESLNQKIEKLESDLMSRVPLSQLDELNALHSKEIAEKDERIAAVEIRARKLATTCQSLKVRSETLSKQLKESEEKPILTEENDLSKENERLKIQLDKLEKEQQEFLNQKQEIVELVEERDSLKDRVENLETELQEMVESYESEAKEMVSDKTLLGDKNRLLEELSSLKTDIDQKDAKIEKLTAAIQKFNVAKNQFIKLREDFKLQKDNLESKLEQQKKEHELHVSVLTSQWKAKISAAERAKRNIVESPPESKKVRVEIEEQSVESPSLKSPETEIYEESENDDLEEGEEILESPVKLVDEEEGKNLRKNKMSGPLLSKQSGKKKVPTRGKGRVKRGKNKE